MKTSFLVKFLVGRNRNFVDLPLEKPLHNIIKQRVYQLFGETILIEDCSLGVIEHGGVPGTQENHFNCSSWILDARRSNG